jgi:hypothetical protein
VDPSDHPLISLAMMLELVGFLISFRLSIYAFLVFDIPSSSFLIKSHLYPIALARVVTKLMKLETKNKQKDTDLPYLEEEHLFDYSTLLNNES